MKNIASINSSKFFLKNTNPYNAFIWLGKNFIEVAVTDIDCQKIEAIQSFKKENGNITRSEALNVFQLQDVKGAEGIYVGLESDKFTLIPDNLFDSRESSKYLNTIFNIESIETITAQKIIPIDCHSVFSLKKGTQELLNNELGGATVLHAPSALLIAYQQLLPPNKELYSFIRVNDDNIVISLFKNKDLQFHQSFEINDTADILYYFLNSLELHGFEKAKTTATIFGRNPELEGLKTILTENIETVKYTNRLPTLQYTDEIFSQPAHRFFNLFALVLCA